MLDKITAILQKSNDLHQRLLQNEALIEETRRVVRKAIEILGNGGKIMLCGNGGSASDAQHIAAELTGRYYLNRPALDAIALTTNTSALTAISNDYGYEMVFSRQVEAHGRPGDMLIGISTSGKSTNILQAFRKAKDLDIHTVLMTGEFAGLSTGNIDFCLAIPAKDTPRIQEGHILIGHILCELIEAHFFGMEDA